MHLTHDPIDPGRLLASVGTSHDGGIGIFLGMVRDHHQGREVLHLEYEAHQPMAEAEIDRLVEKARARWEIGDVIIEHRLGRLEIGDMSVVVIVSAAHRAEALDACRWLIDTLKAEVPIFKKEFYAGGEAWVE